MGGVFSRLVRAFKSRTGYSLSAVLFIAIYFYRKRKKRLPLNLPKDCNSITLSFLRAHFSEHIASFQVEPLKVEVQEGITKDNGGGISSASVARISFQCGPENDPKVPENAIVKIFDADSGSTESFTNRLLAVVWGMDVSVTNAAEVAVYDYARRAFDDSGIKIPVTYFTATSHSLDVVPRYNSLLFLLFNFRPAFRTIVITESFHETHRPCYQGKGLRPSWVLAAFRNIAQLHYKFFNRIGGALPNPEASPSVPSPSLYRFSVPQVRLPPPSYLKILPKWNPWYKNVMIGASTKNFINRPMTDLHKDGSVEKMLDQWASPSGDAVLAKVGIQENIFRSDSVRRSCRRLRELCSEEGFYGACLNQVDPYTLTHGDFHGWNHLFPQNKTVVGGANDVVLVDFQLTSPGRIGWELVYFLMMSVDFQSFEMDKEYLDAYYDRFEKLDKGDKSKNPFFDVRVYTRDAFYREIYATMCACAIKWASKYMAEYVGPSFWDGMYERDEKGERAANVGVHYLTRVFARLRGMHGAGMLEHDRIVLTVLL
jgi:hypothetical protein